MNRILVGGVVAMAVVLMLSNYLVRFPLGDWLTYAAFTYPIAFLITDCTNRAAGCAVAGRVVAFCFVFGVPLSFVFILTTGGEMSEAVRVSAASGVAFAIAQTADIAVFHRLRHLQVWWLPPLASSAPASALDTMLFFCLAFVGTGVPWTTLAIGDLLIKALMVFLLLVPYRMFCRYRASV